MTVAHMGHAMALTKLSGIRFSGDKVQFSFFIISFS
jgi:hypothetical protein